MLAVVIFLLDNPREKRSVPRLNRQVLHIVAKILVAHRLKIAGLVEDFRERDNK